MLSPPAALCAVQVELPLRGRDDDGDDDDDDDDVAAKRGSKSGSGSAAGAGDDLDAGLTQSQTDVLEVASRSSLKRDAKMFKRIDFGMVRRDLQRDDDDVVRELEDSIKDLAELLAKSQVRCSCTTTTLLARAAARALTSYDDGAWCVCVQPNMKAFDRYNDAHERFTTKVWRALQCVALAVLGVRHPIVVFLLCMCTQDAEWKQLRQAKIDKTAAFEKVRNDRLTCFFALFDHVSDRIDGVYKEFTTSARYKTGGSASLVLANRDDPFAGAWSWHRMQLRYVCHGLCDGLLRRWHPIQRHAAVEALHGHGQAVWR